MRQKTNKRTFSFLKRTALWYAASLLPFLSVQALEVERLRTEAVKNPVGIDVEKPLFSWRMDAGNERGVKQTAYEITVFSDANCTEQVWTSGRVMSDRQIDVAYEGDKLQPSTRYYWNVTVWDNKGGESTSTEEAYFETGLMGGGWNGARWIQATDTQLGDNTEDGITHYSIEADFEVDNISTGMIFAANEDQSHYYMWQINFEAGYARLRPHVFRGDQQFATCLEEIDLRPLIDMQLHQTYHLRIEIEGNTAYTYINDILVDSRTNPDGGNYGYGNIGLWEYGAERAYFDNIIVTDLSGETPEILISEDFSDVSNPFTSGTITDGRLLINGASWYKTESGEEEHNITHYTIETDFEIDNLSAGIIFGSNENHSHYYMWQVNLEAGYPRLRPHIWRGPNLSDATCLAEIDLRQLVNVQLHQTYHLRIEVDGSVARTYIDDILVDTRNEPDGGTYGYGQIGIRQDAALNDPNNPEKAYFDNFTVTNLDGDTPEVILSEDFSDGINPFSTGQIKEERLFVEGSYSWYIIPKESNLFYDVDLDFIVERDNAGIIFSGYDTNNFHMWGINIHEKATPFLRRHVKTNGSFATSDTDLSTFFSKTDLTNSLHHLKISIRGTVIQTYIDGQLVDTYSDTSGRLINGLIGFRAYYDRTMNETAYYDNIKVTTYNDTEDTQGTVTFSEDFEGAGMAFSDGTVVVKENSKMLCVQSTYDETCSMQTGTEKGMPLFRKAFTTKGAVRSAKIYASALGVFDLYLNGKRVGVDGTEIYDELKPGWTDYRKEINYMTYDVTSLMHEGDNVVGAQVSNGWWGGAIAHGVYGTPTLGFIAQLRIEYEDGSVEYVVTDTDWSSSYYGPLISGDIYNGETYDARRESEWSSPEYDASGWNFTAENTEFHGEITAFRGQTVRVRDEFRLTPKSITVYEGAKSTGTTYGEINVTRTLSGTEPLQLKAGETALFDLGQNMTGWIRFTAKGHSGTNLRIKFGEMLNDNGASDRLNDGPGGSLYTYNLRTAEATLHYTLKGTEYGETFQPSTTFFGFRYCEITSSSDVEISQLTGEFVGSDLEEHATFETNHPDVNQLYSNIRWSQRDNFLSVPTDCPQRDERLGWTGDAQVFVRAATYHADTRAFYAKWLNDLRQSQREDGAYPDIAPYCNFWGYGTAGWGDAGIIVPWTVYLMTEDQRVLEDSYVSMSHYMDWLTTQSGSGYTYNGAGTATGDWLAYETTDSRYVSVCYYAYVAQLMSKIAGALSESQTDNYYTDSLNYVKLYNNIKTEWQSRYLNADGQLTISTQASYLMALKFGLLPESSIEQAREILREKIENNGYKLSTGFLGTSILNQTLSEQGMDDLAYDLLLQRENPSWLYSVDQGATTIWERWDSYTKDSGFNKHEWNMNSFNHYSYGVVSEWMFRRMAGIEADENQPGFKHFFLMPTPDDRTYFPADQERITNVKATHESGYGLICSEWRRGDDGRISYKTTIPANSTATLYLPVLNGNDEITEGGKALEEAEGVTFKGIKDGKAVIGLESGSYEFTTEEGKGDHVEETAYKSFRIHPNPFHDILNISCNETVRQVSVTAGNGQTVCIQNHGGNINTSAWTPGLYIVQVDTAEGRYCTKAIKE